MYELRGAGVHLAQILAKAQKGNTQIWSNHKGDHPALNYEIKINSIYSVYNLQSTKAKHFEQCILIWPN